MTKIKNYCTLFLLSIFVTNGLYSQNQPSKADSIDAQFNQVINSSRNYEIYKIVKKEDINNLRKQTEITIRDIEKRVARQADTIEAKTNRLEAQTKELKSIQDELKESIKSKDELSIFGVKTLKTTYQAIVLGVLALFVLVILILVYKYRESQSRTLQAEKSLSNMQTEYNDYRKTALDAQQKLGRQLQDERNKNKQD